MKFGEMSISDRTIAALGEMGYTEATEVQEKTVPLMLAGRDVMVRSQTGTGKTAAFGIGLIEVITKNRGRKALILAPTRELAAQITKELRSIAKHHNLNIFSVYGGTGMGKQVSLLRKGFDIVVATPGRLLDHVRQGTIRLEYVNWIVLDEADRMLDMGFKPDIDKVLSMIGKDRQVSLFSATLDGEIQGIARKFMENPEIVEVGNVGKVEKIDEHFIELSRAEKLDRLTEILKNEPMSRTLIFLSSKIGVEKICRKLNANGIDANYLHGGLSQGQRDRAVRGFQEGSYRILVATDVAARGIHVDGISHVINYDQADSEKMHTHRIGRTGRMGEGGKAITFVETDPLPKKHYGGRGGGRSGGQSSGYGSRPAARGGYSGGPRPREGYGGGSRSREGSGGESDSYGGERRSSGHSSGFRSRPRDNRNRKKHVNRRPSSY